MYFELNNTEKVKDKDSKNIMTGDSKSDSFAHIIISKSDGFTHTANVYFRHNTALLLQYALYHRV